MSRHRDPADQRRRRDNAWNRLDDRMVTRGWVGGISLAVVGAVVCCVAAAATSVAPDVTARATVPLPTAARSVTVEVSYGPAPSMSIGADGAWDPESDTLSAPRTVSATQGYPGASARATAAPTARRTTPPEPTVTPASEPTTAAPTPETDAASPTTLPSTTETVTPTPTETAPPNEATETENPLPTDPIAMDLL